MGFNRKLAAIVFTDIAGYTAMMQKDEYVALQKLNHFRNDINRIVPQFNGEIIQYYGDGCLLTFNSALNAIKCSVELQNSLKTDPAVPVRIGVHQGDIIVEEENIFGNNVNIAARVESMSIPGAILLSAKVQSELRNQTDIQLHSLGNYEFKNVEEPIEVFAYAGEGFPIPRKDEITGKFKNQNEEKSIAVLAFKNQSSDPEQEYFGEGIAEEIIYGLSQLNNLKVAGRSSSFSFKNSNESLINIAQQLKVAHILEGSVRKAANRVRVNIQLVDAADGFQIWTERYDRELEDIFSIQDEIAEKVVSKLKLSLLGQEKNQTLISRKTNNVQAYELYLQGRSYLDQRSQIEKALTCFNEAISLDSNFAAAYTSLAYAYFYKIVFDNYAPKEGYPKAEIAAQKALKLDNTIAEAHTMQGLVNFYFHNQPEKARQEYEKALIIQPKLADTYRVKAYFHAMLLENDLAIASAEKAYELDPIGYNVCFSLGDIYYRTGTYEAALNTYQSLLKKYPNHTLLQQKIGVIYYLMGEKDKAKDIILKPENLPLTANVYNSDSYIIAAHLGETEHTKNYLNTLLNESSDKWISPCIIAILYFSLGENEKGVQCLQQAADENDSFLYMFNCLPLWKDYKNIPQVENFLKS